MIQIVGKDCRVPELPADREVVLRWIQLFSSDFSEVIDFATKSIPWANNEWRDFYKRWMED